MPEINEVTDRIIRHCKTQGCAVMDTCTGRHCPEWSRRIVCSHCHKDGMRIVNDPITGKTSNTCKYCGIGSGV